MGSIYNFRYLGGPRDGRMDQRHLSLEEFFDFLDRIPKQDESKPKLLANEEAHYELVDFKDGTFYFEWLKPE
jgi:hypothetical protein